MSFVPIIIRSRFVESDVIKTSKSVNDRGDKDCIHRKYYGFYMVDDLKRFSINSGAYAYTYTGSNPRDKSKWRVWAEAKSTFTSMLTLASSKSIAVGDVIWPKNQFNIFDYAMLPGVKYEDNNSKLLWCVPLVFFFSEADGLLVPTTLVRDAKRGDEDEPLHLFTCGTAWGSTFDVYLVVDPGKDWHIDIEIRLNDQKMWTVSHWSSYEKLGFFSSGTGWKLPYRYKGRLLSTENAWVLPDFFPFNRELVKLKTASRLYEARPRDLWRRFGRNSELWHDKRDSLIAIACEGLRRLNINSWAYLNDLFEIRESLKPVLELLRQPKKFKNWRNLYLNYRYGLRLFFEDTKEIIKSVEKTIADIQDAKYTALHSRARLSGRETLSDGTRINWTYTLKVRTEPFDSYVLDQLMAISRLTRDWDFVMTPSKAWDFIPLSFVAEWLLPVQNFLERVEAYDDVRQYNVRDLLWGAKLLIRYPTSYTESQLGTVYDGSAVIYERWHTSSDDLSFPTFDSTAVGAGVSLIHTADALAIAHSIKYK